jgi:glucose-6-phosphate 1-dehydrogenase
MKRKSSEVTIEFKKPPHIMFDLPEEYAFASNRLTLCIQPDEGIHLKFEAKKPDSAQETQSADMEFHYRSAFGDGVIPEAYERLLLDALKGDASLFARSDEIELAWSLIDPVIRFCEYEAKPPLTTYEPGSWGPSEADELLARDDHTWQKGCSEHE